MSYIFAAKPRGFSTNSEPLFKNDLMFRVRLCETKVFNYKCRYICAEVLSFRRLAVSDGQTYIRMIIEEFSFIKRTFGTRKVISRISVIFTKFDGIFE